MKLNISKKDIKTNGGITLIALVVTIIVLLILAGVAIATLTGDNGILTKAGDARNTNIDAEIEEEIRLAWNKVYMDSYLDSTINKANALKTELEKNGHTVKDVSANENKITITNYRGKDKVLDVSTGTITPKESSESTSVVAKAISEGTVYNDNTPMTDEYGNTFIIPKGFKLSKDSAEVVTEGIVIEDATYTNTKGSEFVWIPVSKDSTDANKVKGATKNTTILLSRYTFDDDGVPYDKGANTIDDYYTELASSSYGNAVAKTDVTSANGFIAKTNVAGGFWIGRYEARIEGYTSLDEECPFDDPNWVGYTGGKLVEKPGAQVFNYITQNKASELSRTMYSSNNYFESDLINSYAWDTATLFLQEYDNRTYNINTNSNYKAKYSRQIRLSTRFKNTGTNASSITAANKDKICNVYDMADNCYEWTTETCSGSGMSCVGRGGIYLNSDYYTSSRDFNDTSDAYGDFSFRPVLYIK